MLNPKWVIIATAAFILAGCTQTTPTTQVVPQTDGTPVEDGFVQEPIFGQDENAAAAPVSISMVMNDMSYAPNSLNVRPGDMVTLILENPDTLPHDLIIDELGVNTGNIQPGQSVEISFPIPDDASGRTYAFYCSVGDHRAQGMEGVIIVE